jgi:hypothetical protein
MATALNHTGTAKRKQKKKEKKKKSKKRGEGRGENEESCGYHSDQPWAHGLGYR